MVVVPPCASGSKNTILLIDTPGLFAPHRSSVFDAEASALNYAAGYGATTNKSLSVQLLAMVNLMSSVVLYNNMGTIDRASVERISFAVGLF